MHTNRHVLGCLLLVGLLATAAACDQLPAAAHDLSVGDCFQEPTAADDVSEIQRRPCTEAHDAEVFHVVDYEGETYPIEMTLDRFIDEQCRPAFEGYTGTAFDSQSELSFGWFYPTRASWNDGDREVTCYVVRDDGEPLTGSVRVAD